MSSPWVASEANSSVIPATVYSYIAAVKHAFTDVLNIDKSEHIVRWNRLFVVLWNTHTVRPTMRKGVANDNFTGGNSGLRRGLAGAQRAGTKARQASTAADPSRRPIQARTTQQARLIRCDT